MTSIDPSFALSCKVSGQKEGAALDRDHFSLLALRIGPRAYDGAF